MKYIKNKSNTNGFDIKAHLSLLVICLMLTVSAQAQLFGGVIHSAKASGSINPFECGGVLHSGVLTQGVAASGVSSSLPYTGGNGGPYTGQSISSTGVTGLTATLTGGNFANGNGTLSFNITGTPASFGTASFDISLGGQSCVLVRQIAVIIPATITLAQNQRYFVASVYDQNYLPYSLPTGPASTAVVNPDGTNEAVTVNVQGSITTTGINVPIAVTATGSGTLPAFSTTINVPAALTEDGIGRDLTLSWAAQAYTTATQTITANIKAVGGTLNAKKLDINAGIGNDFLGVLMGSFSYPYNSAGNTSTLQARIIAGIPDKMFGLADNSGTIQHQFLYLPVQGEDGKVWLNNNLGAHYADLNSAHFNLAQQATSATDHRAYGSLFQWGRKPDGHELITWTSATAGTARYGSTTTRNNAPTHTLFISNSTSPYDWRSTQDNTLWASQASANNPCPSGFRVPTDAELTTLYSAAGISNRATAASSNLRFTVSGYRHYAGGPFNSVGNNGHFWSSTVSGSEARCRSSNSSSTDMYSLGRGLGANVRCIKD